MYFIHPADMYGSIYHVKHATSFALVVAVVRACTIKLSWTQVVPVHDKIFDDRTAQESEPVLRDCFCPCQNRYCDHLIVIDDGIPIPTNRTATAATAS